VARIGVFICWCGENSRAGRSTARRVATEAAGFPGVVHAVDYKLHVLGSRPVE